MASTFRCTSVLHVLHSPLMGPSRLGSLYVLACLHLEIPDFDAYQIAGVIGTGLFLGLGQLLATTGPLGVLLVFLLVGSVAFAFVIFAIFV